VIHLLDIYKLTHEVLTVIYVKLTENYINKKRYYNIFLLILENKNIISS